VAGGGGSAGRSRASSFDSIDEDGGLWIQGQRLVGDRDGLREIAMQEMDLALPVAHLGIDRPVGSRLVEDRQGLVDLIIVGQSEGILSQQGRIPWRQGTRLGG